MKNWIWLLFLPAIAIAASPGATYLQFSKNGIPSFVYEDAVTPSNSVGLPVSLVGGLTIGSVNQGAPGPAASPWPVTFPAGVSANQGAPGPTASPWPVMIPSGVPVPVTGTFWQAVQPVSAPSALPVSVVSPLPAGTNSIGSVTQGTPGPTASPWPVAVENFPTTQPVSGTFWQSTQPVSGTFWQATQPVSGTFWQTTQPVSIASPVPITASSPLPTMAPVNANATLSARQTVTTSETSLAAPLNAVAIVLECESGNSDNLRWGFSNSSTAILSSTLGMLCEPGRSEDLQVGAGTYLHMISTGSVGTDTLDAQWILAQ